MDLQVAVTAKWDRWKDKDTDAAAMEILHSLAAVAENSLKGILAEAKRNIVEDDLIETELLKKSLKIKSKAKRNRKNHEWTGGTFYALIGSDKNIKGVDKNGNLVRPHKYAHLIENGHEIVVARGASKGEKRGDVRSYYFMSRAVASYINTIQDDLTAAAEEAWKNNIGGKM